MLNFEHPQVKAFVRRNKLNENNTSPYVMQQWSYNVNEMREKAEKRPRNDVRRCFEC